MTPTFRAFVLVTGLAAMTTACVPDTDVDESKITLPRVLAISSEPAEAREGEAVKYTALFVDRDGTREDGVLAWFQCSARLPLSELSPVSKVCLDPFSDKNTPFGNGLSASIALPRDACALFGPNPPTPKAGEDPGRPVDADATGGYKVPILLGVRADVDENLVVYEQRLSCNLSGAAPAISAEFRRRYRINENPAINQVVIHRADGHDDVPSEGATVALDLGEKVNIEVRLLECPTEDSCGDGICGLDESRTDCAEDCTQPRGCTGSETFLKYDPYARTLTEEREALRFAWYSTDGALHEERTGISADRLSRASANDYTASTSASSASVFVVVRDSRGGVGYRQVRFEVN